jgi:hypothetical protein
MSFKQKSYRNKKRKIRWLWPILAIVLLAVTVLILELMNVTYLFHKRTAHTSNQYTKGEPVKQTSDDTGTSDDHKDKANSTANDAQLITPNGVFVSAHRVSLDSNPLLQSSCETTPSATCQIVFSKDGAELSLDQKTTDTGGAAYWTWKPKDLGLTAGSWKVQAVAKQAGKTLTADDAMNLEVNP